MRKYFFPYIASTILVILIVACNSNTEPANATPRFGGDPKKVASNAPNYSDSNSAELNHAVQRLDSYYAIQCRHGFNGSVLIGYKGKILYERYYGYANREELLRLDANSASQLASTSKTFTAAAVLYLNQQKYLNIDEKVKTYLPQFPYDNITVRMLLCHRSGIPDYLKWALKYYPKNKPITNSDLMDLFARVKPPLESRPNTKFKYCNSNYAILASIIEEVTEISYPDFMKKYIFEPLGMKHTFVYNPYKACPYGTAISYKGWRREPDQLGDGVYGDKGIYSTVQDMYRWDQSFYRNTFLNNETLEMAYGPCSFEKKGQKNYGLGWRMLCFTNGNKIIYHNGWWHGNNTVFYRFIQENFTIIILGNKLNNNIYRQTKVLYSIIKNKPVSEGFDEEG